MAEKFALLAESALDGAINNSVTTLDVLDASGFPTSGDFRILIESEILKVTGVSGTTFTVARGQEGTSASSHADAETVSHVLTAGAIDSMEQNDLVVRDAYASKPAAGTPGRLFLPTDGIMIERDTGSVWTQHGPIWNMTPPVAADFGTWLNQSTASIADNKGTVFLQCPAIASVTLRGVYKTYPTPPFTVEMAFILHGITSDDIAAGMFIRQNSTDDVMMFGAGRNNETSVWYLKQATASTSMSLTTPTGVQAAGLLQECQSGLTWVKYEDDNTSRKVSFSHDGLTWVEVYSQSRTSFITPDQMGLFVNPNGSVYPTGISVLHWRQY